VAVGKVVKDLSRRCALHHIHNLGLPTSTLHTSPSFLLLSLRSWCRSSRMMRSGGRPLTLETLLT